MRGSIVVVGLMILALGAPACGSEDGPTTPASATAKTAAGVEMPELGVRAVLPAGWTHLEKSGKRWIMRSASYAASISKRGPMPATLDEAVSSWMVGEVSAKGATDNTGYYGVIETEFPTGDGPPMKIPTVFVQVPVGADSVLCTGQLQPGDDPKPMVAACQTIRAM